MTTKITTTRSIVLGATLLLYGALSASVNAQDQDAIASLFTVFKISVDETDRSAALARTKAVKRAERKAYDTLLRRLVPAAEIPRAPFLSDEELSRMVRGFEVSNEATSRGRYIADIDIAFMPDPIINLWTNAGLTFALNAGPNLCVVHGHFTDTQSLLWERANPAHSAWENTDWQNALRDYTPLESTIEARAAIDVSLFNGELTEVSRLASHYCPSRNLLILKTEEKQNGSAYKFWVSDVMFSGRGMIERGEDEDITSQLTRALNETLYAIDENWRALSTVDGGLTQDLSLLIEVQQIEDLARARNELSKLSVINNVTTDKIAVPMSKITVSYTGNIDQLALAVRQAGYTISEWGDEFMLVPLVN